MLCAKWIPYRLVFKFEARTSRASMAYKDTYFIKVWESERPQFYGLGECALFKGLSQEDDDLYEERLDRFCLSPESITPSDSSIRFGFETAFADMKNRGCGFIYKDNNGWTDGEIGIPINGLIWMGDKNQMFQRIKQKLDEGFKCLKLKIGGIDFYDELSLLKYIRSQFDAEVLELRLDANGAFSADNALDKLYQLACYDIHSIEQPIKAGQHEAMAEICEKSPIDIALDEELIGTTTLQFKKRLLETIKPKYIILKPALCGGLHDADDWIDMAHQLGIKWWATSALESNIGLNAIAQWVAAKHPEMCQGLGTGELYFNNIPSPIERRGSELFYNPNLRRCNIDF